MATPHAKPATAFRSGNVHAAIWRTPASKGRSSPSHFPVPTRTLRALHGPHAGSLPLRRRRQENACQSEAETGPQLLLQNMVSELERSRLPRRYRQAGKAHMSPVHLFARLSVHFPRVLHSWGIRFYEMDQRTRDSSLCERRLPRQCWTIRQ
jgi:hypothetical protein